MRALVRTWSLRRAAERPLRIAAICVALLLAAVPAGAQTSLPSRPILFVYGYCGTTDSWSALRTDLATRLNGDFPTLYPLADSSNYQDPTNYYEVYYDGTTVHFGRNGLPVVETTIPAWARFFSMDFFDPDSGTFSPSLVQQVSILNKAEELAQVLREINRVTQISDVIVIAHSMGGLVTRAYLENMASVLSCYDYKGGSGGSPDYANGLCLLPQPDQYGGEIAQLITLDTPHGGADLAGFNSAGFFNDIFPGCTEASSTTHSEQVPGSALLQNLNYSSTSIATASPVPARVSVQAVESFYSDGIPGWEALTALADPLFCTTDNDGLISFDNQSMEMSLSTQFKNGAQFGDWGNPYPKASLTGAACQETFAGLSGTVLHLLGCVGGQSNTQGLVYSLVKPIVSGALDSITVRATLQTGSGPAAVWEGPVQYHLQASSTIGGQATESGAAVPFTFSPVPVGDYQLVYDSGGPPGTLVSVSVAPVLTILNSQNWNPTFTIFFDTAAASAPTVLVTPLSSSITAAQALTVTVAVSGASGSPTPTGSATLTSGSYSSVATTLTNGGATIIVPTGSLAIGADTLTVSYTPDAASSSTYSTASGSSSVTVSAAVTSAGTLMAGSTVVAPGGAFSIPITLTLNSGVNVDALRFGIQITPNGSAPALAGPLGFTKDASIADTPFTTTAGASNAISVLWTSLSSPLSGTRTLGVVGGAIPAGAATGQSYAAVVTGLSAASGGAVNPVAVSIGPNGALNVADTYLVGDVYPYTSDVAPNFGDGVLDIRDLIQELFAVNSIPGYRPAACSARFDAMDLYPADTASTRGGDGVLDIRDLIQELFRVNNLDMSRPVRGALPWAACASYPVGTNPYGVAFDGANIWVANAGSNTVTKLLASTGATVGTYPVGTIPTGVAFDGANIWVANEYSSTVTKLLAFTGATVGTYPVGTNPYGIAFDGANIWVANRGSSTVTKLLASTGATVGTYTVGDYPSLGIAFDGANIWVASFPSNIVTKLLASTGATVGTYGVGTMPNGIAFDGANIWVVELRRHQQHRDEAAGLYWGHSGHLHRGNRARWRGFRRRQYLGGEL